MLVTHTLIAPSAIAILPATAVAAPVAPAATAPLPNPSSRQTVTIPGSIDATGTKDVTVGLNRFFESLRSGTTVVFPPHAIYRAEGTLVLLHKLNLTIDGNGSTLKAKTDGSGAAPTPGRAFEWPRSRASILVEDSSNVRIENLLISGPNDPGGPGSYRPQLEAQAGVDVEGSGNVAVVRCVIRHTFGDFVYISGWSENVQVLDNTLTSNGRQGVSVTNGRDVLIEGNAMYGAARSAIDLEPNTAAGMALDVDIYDNEFVKAGLGFVSAEGAGSHVDYVNVVGNRLIDMPMDIMVRASDGAPRHNWAVFDNWSDVVAGSPIAPIEFYYVSGVTVDGNHQAMASDRPSVAIYLVHPCNWSIADNSFPGAEATEPQGIAGRCQWRNDAANPPGSGSG
jgi:parallel beta helix pectate lyase-like protein